MTREAMIFVARGAGGLRGNGRQRRCLRDGCDRVLFSQQVLAPPPPPPSQGPQNCMEIAVICLPLRLIGLQILKLQIPQSLANFKFTALGIPYPGSGCLDLLPAIYNLASTRFVICAAHLLSSVAGASLIETWNQVYQNYFHS